jgi:hypothetical protein
MPGTQPADSYPERKLVITGGGIIGYLEAYYAFLDARKRGERLRITIYEKNAALHDTTVGHLVPSLSPFEILAVVPAGTKLLDYLERKFTETDGLRVDDVPGVIDSPASIEFLNAVRAISQDEAGYQARRETLIKLGERSMALWQKFYDEGDDSLKAILEKSNFNPARERSRFEERKLHDGYRFHLLFNTENALHKAHEIIEDFERLGYQDCAILSPKEVMAIDPFLTDFCLSHSLESEQGERIWNHDAVALWRPGGCIDTQVFLPLFHQYLQSLMGQYLNANGEMKQAFVVHHQRKVEQVFYDAGNRINGIRFFGGEKIKYQKPVYHETEHVFCPGESVGTLKSLGFFEPPCARFAGASLLLNIPVSEEQRPWLSQLSEYMSIINDGISSVWQARLIGDTFMIGIAGTKAYYGHEVPSVAHEFARNRNLVQLNMLNKILPRVISLAFERDTKGVLLTESDLQSLVDKQLVKQWVGSRGVAFDAFPTWGLLRNGQGLIGNARGTLLLGSGGVSFSHAAVLTSRGSDLIDSELSAKALELGDARRTPSP